MSFPLPGIGVVFAFLGLTLLGFLAANPVGRSLIRLGEGTLARMPIVRSIYKGAKQVFETACSQSGATFRRVGMIEYPGEGQWSLVFISTPPGASIAGHLSNEEHISVCTPQPDNRILLCRPAM